MTGVQTCALPILIAGGKLMGIVGMFLFIPLASVCYTLFRQLVYEKLKKKLNKHEVP